MEALNVHFQTMPKYACVDVTHSQLRAIMKATGGRIEARGQIWSFVSRPCKSPKGQFSLSLKRVS